MDSTTTPTFSKAKTEPKDDFEPPQIRLNWKLTGDGPGADEKVWVSFLKQGFLAAVVDDAGNTMALTFVPRPKFKTVGGRTIVEAAD